MQNTITIQVKEAKPVNTEKQISLPAFIKKHNLYTSVLSKERLLIVGIYPLIKAYNIQSDMVNSYTFDDVEFISESEFNEAFDLAIKKITEANSILKMALSDANKTEDQEKQELRHEAQIGDAIESGNEEEVENE